MLRTIASRLGLILFLAMTARGIGFFFAPTHPQPPRIVHDMTATADDPPPTSPEMRRAIAQVKQRGWGDTSGAQLTYGRGADSVTVTRAQLAAARALVRADRAMLDRLAPDPEAERADAVSFKPGEPMIDPNPGAH